jgi:hypothetical protein
MFGKGGDLARWMPSDKATVIVESHARGINRCQIEETEVVAEEVRKRFL